MRSWHKLPWALQVLSLLFASATYAEPASLNDPFRAVVLQIPKRPGPPMCCLKTVSQLETTEDELLSFEEWKAKQSQRQTQENLKHLEQDNSSNPVQTGASGSAASDGASQDAPVVEGSQTTSHTLDELAPILPAETVLPHFQVPTTDRYNYANLDCTARVHAAHRSAKSATSILSSKKDRYMLSPCKGPKNEKKFVIVELCDDIRIDTVQLANFEFFSGVFKDFSVSVAKTYTDTEGWAHAGTYRAKNVRSIQTFRFPETLRDFYRYIRIDFHSHYGNEYYCPVSLLRVYGLTHLEEWKWDIWVAESRAKQAEALKGSKPLVISASSNDTVETTPDDPSRTSVQADIHSTIDPSIIETLATLSNRAAEMSKSVLDDINSSQSQVPALDSGHDLASKQPDRSIHEPHDSHVSKIPSHSTNTLASPRLGSSHSASTAIPSISSSPVVKTPLASSASPASTNSPQPSNDVPSQNASNSTLSRTTQPSASSVIILTAPSVVSTPPIVTPSQATTGGESVYRTIMNKLVALETNYTLYTRYMDQQNGAIRELIRRLGEDIGRLEGATRAQRAHSQKMVNEWEKQRLQMMVDYSQLASRVEHLSEEILLEKRLGAAQLCLMLALLVFMGLTRGSRGEAVVVNGQASVREWGKRHLSLSGDWTNRFRRKSTSRVGLRSRPATGVPIASPAKTTSTLPDDTGHEQPAEFVEFPGDDWDGHPKRPLEPLPLNTYHSMPIGSPSLKKATRPRSRTSSTKTLVAGKRIPASANATPQATFTTPAHLRPQLLQRSSSHGAHSPAGRTSKSVKKWARTAHLHPARSPLTLKLNSENANPQGDVYGSNGLPVDIPGIFTAPAGAFDFPRGTKDRLPTMPQTPTRSGKKRRPDDILAVTESLARVQPQGSSLTSESSGREDEGDASDANWIDTDSVVESDLDPDTLPLI